MSDSTEASAAMLTQWFKDADTSLGQEWLDSADSDWINTSLHSLVVTSCTLTPQICTYQQDLPIQRTMVIQARELLGTHSVFSPK
jgi:hypothetical protein